MNLQPSLHIPGMLRTVRRDASFDQKVQVSASSCKVSAKCEERLTWRCLGQQLFTRLKSLLHDSFAHVRNSMCEMNFKALQKSFSLIFHECFLAN